jgi:hypothetical protein
MAILKHEGRQKRQELKKSQSLQIIGHKIHHNTRPTPSFLINPWLTLNKLAN